MPDQNTTQMIVGSGMGSVGALLGGSVSILLSEEVMSRKKVLIYVLGSLGFGSFLPPALISYFNVHAGVSGFLGFIAGLSVIGLITGVQKVSQAFGKSPGAFILTPGIKAALEDKEKPK